MKHLKKIPFFCLLLFSVILFTVCAILGRKNIYQPYIEDEELTTEPLLTVVFKGIHNDVMPWDTLSYVGIDLPFLRADSTENPPTDEVPLPTTELPNDFSQEPGASGAPTPEQEPTDDTPQEPIAEITIPPATPTPTPVPLGPDGLPLVEYMCVDDSYFDDAVFIGDSRTRSLQLYSGLDNTTFLAETGLTIQTVLDRKLTPSNSTQKITVREYLATHQFKKVYLMLGINELGSGTAESFVEDYAEVLQTIRELQPDAVIYLQAILNISEAKHKEGTYINNDTIMERNALLKTLADNVTVFWLDANQAICDENHFLRKEYTFDGVHLQAKYVPIWVMWLESNAVDLGESLQ